MATLRMILIDQLSFCISSLNDLNTDDIIFMCEVIEETSYVKHHPKKITFIFAAMRHFAKELTKKQYKVRYVKFNDPDNTHSLELEIKRAINDTQAKKIIVTEPSEYKHSKLFANLSKLHDLEVDIKTDTRFLCEIDEFKLLASKHAQFRMEYFYREMRKKHKILIEADGTPTGGQWNFDKQNRKTPSASLRSPKRISHKKDQITKDVIELVKMSFSDRFGKLEPFHYAVTREQALLELDHFIINILPSFGDYQDAMIAGEAYLYHSLISSYLNVGLLLPLEICHKAEAAYKNGAAPINSVEGFIRQVLGWREFVRGIYWMYMPEYATMNFLNATNPLPKFYWTATTKMSCVAEAVRQTEEHAYSHHIQRLMITGNFALLAGIDVKQVQEWYLSVYSDAFEWVEMPNTLGMALFGDGGIIGSKPYAASGKYIKRMSNFCKNCIYNPDETTTDNACPFNSLYWDFLVRNIKKLQKNVRLAYAYANWEKFAAEKQANIRAKAQQVLKAMQHDDL